MSKCGAVHDSGVACDMAEGQHPWHSGVVAGTVPPQGVDWQNVDYVAPVRARTSASREQHKAMVRSAMASGGGDPMEAALAHWEATKEQWIRDAKRIVHMYCTTHKDPFTTPQAIWPLLDSPGQMRAFSTVVQHALRRRWIQQTDSVRLRGTYVTKDGKEFKMNKLVPIYTSRIFIQR